MNAFFFSLITFACVFIGGMLGMFLGPMLPQQQAGTDSKDVVRRWLMFAQSNVPVPRLLLFMLIFWLTVLFFSFGLFGPINFTVRSGLFVSALAVAGAIFLILEMYHPHGGFIRVSDAPLRAALTQLGQ